MRRLASSAVLGPAVLVLAQGCVIYTNPQHRPAPPPPPPPAAAPAATTTAVTPVATTTAVAAPPPATGPLVNVDGTSLHTVTANTVFGGPTDGAGWLHGKVYGVPAGTNIIPVLDSVAPEGVVFTPTLSVNEASFSGGFPGFDAGRINWFAIRYEGTFGITTGGEYRFHLVADDGARLSIDGAALGATDLSHPTALKEVAVRLAPGQHTIRVDYLQKTGGVALKLTTIGPSGAERPYASAVLP